MNFKTNIKRTRLKDNLSIRKFALKLNVAENTIRNWESGITRPTIDSIIKIKHRLEVEYEDLID